MATKVCASTTPAVREGQADVEPLVEVLPDHAPARPSAANSATPATTGGSTIDSVLRARSAERPGRVLRARTHARGTPKRSESSVAHPDVHNDRRRVVSVSGAVRISHASPHGALSTRPTTGTAKKAAAIPASSRHGDRDPCGGPS